MFTQLYYLFRALLSKKFYNNFYEGFFLQLLQAIIGNAEFYKNTRRRIILPKYPKTRQLFIISDLEYLPLLDPRQQIKPITNAILDKIIFHADVCPENGWNSSGNSLLSSEPMVRMSVIIFDLLLNKKFAVDCLEILQNMAKTGLFWLDEYQIDIEKKSAETYYNEIVRNYEENPMKLLFPQLDKLEKTKKSRPGKSSKPPLKSSTNKIISLRMSLFVTMLEKYLKQWPETEYDAVLEYDIWLKPVVIKYMKMKKNKYIPRILVGKMENHDLAGILKHSVEFPGSEQWLLLKKYIKSTDNLTTTENYQNLNKSTKISPKPSTSNANYRLLNVFQLSFKFPSIMLLLTEHIKDVKTILMEINLDITYFRHLLLSIGANNKYPEDLMKEWFDLSDELQIFQKHNFLQKIGAKRKRASFSTIKEIKTVDVLTGKLPPNVSKNVLVHDECFNKTKNLTVNRIKEEGGFNPIIMNCEIDLMEVRTLRGFAPMNF